MCNFEYKESAMGLYSMAHTFYSACERSSLFIVCCGVYTRSVDGEMGPVLNFWHQAGP